MADNSDIATSPKEELESTVDEKSTMENGDAAVQSNEEDTTEFKMPEYEDILGNGTLLKQTVKKGTGRRPNMKELVKIQLTSEIPELDKTFPEVTMEYVLGDGDVAQALDLVVALMYIGEECKVISGYKYMYGEAGMPPDIPPCANFKMTVQLISCEPWDYDKMDFATRFAEAKKKKDRGNTLFRRREFERAVNSYTIAHKLVDPMEGVSYSQETASTLQEVLEFRAIVLVNTSTTLFKLEAYEGALNAAQEAVKLRPTYVKGYIRLGQAQEKLGQTDSTIKAYKTALKHDPDNAKWIHGELSRLTQVNRKNKESQQQMYSKMFWGSNPPSVDDSPKSAKSPRTDSTLGTLWKLGVVGGASLVAMVSFGIYRYLHH